MKHAKQAALALAALVLALALAGCGEMTAEKLARKVARAARKVQITQAEMTAGLAAEFSGLPEPGETGVRTVTRMLLSAEPCVAQADTTVTIEGQGWHTSEATPSWLRQEGELLAGYSCLGSTGQWVRSSSPMAESGGLQALAGLDPERLTLLEEKKTIDKTDTWQLSVSLSGQELADILGGVAQLQSALGLLDWQDAPAIQTTFYIHPRSKLPVRIELELETSQMPGGFAGRLLRAAGAESASGGRLHVYYDQIGYEPVEVEGVPIAGLNSAVSAEQLENGEISYVIEENGVQLRLSAGADWYAFGHSADSVTMARQDGSLVVSYTMYTPDADSGYFVPLIESMEVEPVKNDGTYLGHGAGPTLNGFETMYLSCEGSTIYFAWGRVGDACLYLRASQQGGEPDAQGVLSLLLEFAGQ